MNLHLAYITFSFVCSWQKDIIYLKCPAVKLLLILLYVRSYVFAQDKTSLTLAHKLAVAVQATPETGKGQVTIYLRVIPM